jgi:SAM-dependent methyltransferase
VSFAADWLAARAPYDEAALDQAAIAHLAAWGAALPPGYAPVVVDLGSGTGAALRRVARWLAPRPLVGYAVDQDAVLLAHAAAAGPPGTRAVRSDVLRPLAAAGGPADGSVDLVVGHALADLLPLDRLAERAAVLLRPDGLVHLALAYDGLTAFAPDAPLDAEMIVAFHRHMDRPAYELPTYGGSTAGRRLGPALAAAGLDILADAPSVWQVRAGDGPAGRRVLAGLLRYVADAARNLGDVPAADIMRWEQAKRIALDGGTLSVRVGHRDVLARRR